MIRLLLVFVALLSVVSSARAQFVPCVPPWCAYQPQTQERERPPTQRREHQKSRAVERSRREHSARRYSRRDSERSREPASWQTMSQGEAKSWLRDQTREFCRKYPRDEVCQKSERSE